MKRSNIETFLHAFAVVRGFFNPAENNMVDLPVEYKKKVSGMDKETLDSFLDELHDYADVYKDYFSDDDTMQQFDDYISRVFNICNVLEVSTFYPYLLKQLYNWKKNVITEEDLCGSFFEIERYVILNAICKGSTKNYNNECLQMVDGRRTPKEIMDSSIYISEGSFVDGLRRMTTNKLPTLLLFWIELYDRNSLNVDVKSLKYEYTLEHIMPQKWMQNWRDVSVYDVNGSEVEDVDEIEHVRNHAIYEIGNMTLLNAKLNSSISNSAFSDKVNGKNGKKGIRNLADLRLTREIFEDNTEWDERKIYARTAAFENKIREIWDAKELPKEAAVKPAGGNLHSEKSPEEKEKQQKIAQILKEWMDSKSEIIGWSGRDSIMSFTTKIMSKILRDAPEGLSVTPNHYFYQIVNGSTYVEMQLNFNSENLSEEQRSTLNKINDIVERKQGKADWKWWKVYKADKIAIPDDLDKETIFSNLDRALEQTLGFEKKLAAAVM